MPITNVSARPRSGWRRKLLPGLLGVAVALALGLSYAVHALRSESVTVVLTQAELQAKADAAFPMTKTYLLVLAMTYADPVVTLDQSLDRVAVGLTATSEIEVEHRRLAGTALVSGSVRYEPAQAAFFLDGIRVESLEIAGLPERWHAEAGKLTAGAAGLLRATPGVRDRRRRPEGPGGAPAAAFGARPRRRAGDRARALGA